MPIASTATTAAAASGHDRMWRVRATVPRDRAPCRGAKRIVERRGRLFATRGAPRCVELVVDFTHSLRLVQVGQLAAQLVRGVAQPALDGFDAGAGQFGDLGQRQSAFLLQQKRFALRRG